MDKNLKISFFLCLIILFSKLIAIYFTNFGLYGDEAQYWLWSLSPSLGYFSKPPFLSWFLSLYVFIFGSSFFALKLIPVFSYCVTSYVIFLIGKKLYDIKTGIACALSFFVLPAVSVSSFIISTDIMLIMFWSLGLLQLIKTKEHPSYLNFTVLGVILGLCFLSKYAAIYFVISMFCLMIFEKKYRDVFFKSKTKLFYFFLVVFLICSPNIFWNHYNGWITIGHTAENASLNNINIDIYRAIEFLLTQIVMLGPLIFFSFLLYIKKFKDDNLIFLLSFSMPAIVIVTIESLLVRAHANWAAVSLVSLSIFVVAVVYKNNKTLLYFNNLISGFFVLIFFILIGFSSNIKIFDRINYTDKIKSVLEEVNEKGIKNLVIEDRLLFANLKYIYKNENMNIYTPYKPLTKIKHHFQISDALPKNFSSNFILIGNKGSINYLNNKKSFVLKNESNFKFTSQQVKFYEVLFD
ncbi:MAG: hypothetical protein CFH19_00210 [Alphaproteobacteria bacterium MarineAlpha5_Bin9]|nr:MAG: hypothetical protein CFH19_00210 [Alphaproteobacteria bacterium MarineAlpha5_Bin9]|tara:strand:+ start:1959 stop:3353 length:1395 start_codon:yes stop_codon:yes gene_type:complete